MYIFVNSFHFTHSKPFPIWKIQVSLLFGEIFSSFFPLVLFLYCFQELLVVRYFTS